MYPIYRCNVLRRGSVLDILIENEASRSISITLPSFRTTLSRLSGSEPTTFYVDGLRPCVVIDCSLLSFGYNVELPYIPDVLTSHWFLQYNCMSWAFFSLSGSCFSSHFREVGVLQKSPGSSNFSWTTYLFLAYLFSCDLGRVGVSESIVPPFA